MAEAFPLVKHHYSQPRMWSIEDQKSLLKKLNNLLLASDIPGSFDSCRQLVQGILLLIPTELGSCWQAGDRFTSTSQQHA